MIVEASAPSNIALIKYMGKVDTKSNIPTNSSLSLTLDNLRTYVRITLLQEGDQGKPQSDQWKPLIRSDLAEIKLSEKSIQRFLQHLQRMKDQYSIKANFLVESASNFPSDCGLASSASSFAALTIAAAEIFQKINPQLKISTSEQAEVSRKGSGSSCRSFYGPFGLWDKNGVKAVEFPLPKIHHQVVVVESAKKLVSSSEAHVRVAGSSLFPGRVERVEKRLQELTTAFKNDNWKLAYEICWEEFWDMHALFETSRPSFGYMEPGTLEVLQKIRNFWQQENDGPIVTMDAGANVHLIWPVRLKEKAVIFANEMKKKYSVFQQA